MFPSGLDLNIGHHTFGRWAETSKARYDQLASRFAAEIERSVYLFARTRKRALSSMPRLTADWV